MQSIEFLDCCVVNETFQAVVSGTNKDRQPGRGSDQSPCHDYGDARQRQLCLISYPRHSVAVWRRIGKTNVIERREPCRIGRCFYDVVRIPRFHITQMILRETTT